MFLCLFVTVVIEISFAFRVAWILVLSKIILDFWYAGNFLDLGFVQNLFIFSYFCVDKIFLIQVWVEWKWVNRIYKLATKFGGCPKCCFNGNQSSAPEIHQNIALEAVGILVKCYCESGVNMSQLQIVRGEIWVLPLNIYRKTASEVVLIVRNWTIFLSFGTFSNWSTSSALGLYQKCKSSLKRKLGPRKLKWEK